MDAKFRVCCLVKRAASKAGFALPANPCCRSWSYCIHYLVYKIFVYLFMYSFLSTLMSTLSVVIRFRFASYEYLSFAIPKKKHDVRTHNFVATQVFQQRLRDHEQGKDSANYCAGTSAVAFNRLPISETPRHGTQSSRAASTSYGRPSGT